jgi:hypothetical protein
MWPHQALTIHRIIWYNFLYHVDRDMDIAPKLYAWATKVSQPYLEEHDIKLLKMDTFRKTWKEIQYEDSAIKSMDLNNYQGEWIQVSPSRGQTRTSNSNLSSPLRTQRRTRRQVFEMNSESCPNLSKSV